MEIKLTRIFNFLSDDADLFLKEDSYFIDQLNGLLKKFNLILKEDTDDPIFEIIFIESGGTESKFLRLFDELNSDVFLLSQSKNNSLAACFEIKTYASKRGKNVTLISGDLEDVASQIEYASKTYVAKRTIHNSNLGVIGKPSDWLIASMVNSSNVKSKYGINLIDISIEELLDEINKKTYDNISNLNEIKTKYHNPEVLEGALYVYGAVKRLIAKYNLNGLTIRCFDLLSTIKNTACLALALLNQEGIVATCEGDVPSMLTMYFVKCLTNQSCFQANPSVIDRKNNTLMVSHCTLPFDMVESYSLPTHFESNLGVAISGNLQLKNCTIVKLWPDLNHATCIKGKITENLHLKGYCRTQINISLDKQGLEKLLNDNFGNHLIIAYNDIVDLFNNFIKLF